MVAALIRLALSALLVLLPAGGHPDDAIGAIEVKGNERTAREVVIAALRVQPGDGVPDELLPVLRQRVLNLRLFREVEVTKRPSEGGVVLSVAVEERWTLLPIPILGASSGTAQAGLAIFESNFLGRNKLLAVSGIYSSRSQSGFLFYRDPSLFGSRMVLAVELIAENKVRERADGFDVVQAWRDRRVDVSVRPGVLLAPGLALRAGPFAVFRNTRAEPSYPAPPPAGNDFGVAADLEYEGQNYRDWFNEGPFVQARVRRSLPPLGSDRGFTQSSAFATWTLPAARDHAASLSAAGFLVEGDPVLDAFTLGGRPGSRGLRAEGLWAERALTTTLDYQVPVWRPRWGTLTAVGFVDAGVSSWAATVTRFVAPGGGVRLYLRNVALPALGVDLAWSTAGRQLAPSFFLGFR
jgi:outer membrane protein assembly factor BamA